MKHLIFLLLTIQCFATDWYVKNGGTGSNNGTSWTNAWTSFASINWGSISPGDNLYIDGGTDSVVYNAQLTPTANGTSSNYINILAGKYSPSPSGHSGRVIIKGTGTQSIYIQSSSSGSPRRYINIKGLECTGSEKGVHFEDYVSNVTIDSLYIWDFLGQAGAFLNGASEYTIDSVIIKNCRIISPAVYDGETDCIFTQRAGNILVHDNFLHERNQDPLAHTDALQAYLTNGWVVYNNTIINDSVYSTEGGGVPMIFGVQGTRNVMVANNFLYMGGIWYPTGSQGSVWWSRLYPANDSGIRCFVLNNTFVANGPRCRGSIQEYKTTFKNNIIAMFSTSTQMANLEESVTGTPSSIYVDSTVNNLYYRTDGVGSSYFAGSFIGSGGSPTGTPNSTTWLSTYGGSGQFANPNFVNNFRYEPDQSALVPDLESDSPAIDAGNDEFNYESYVDWLNSQGFDGTHPHTGEWMIPKTDIYGNSISGSARDIGAFEYQQAPSTTTKKVRVIIIQ